MNDMSPPKLYATQGTPIVCVRGHTVCHVARDVYVGEPRGNIFADWQQPQPDRKLSIHKIRCAVCKGAWIRKSGDTVQLHFAGGWR